jgi:hypothetical protein
MRAAGRYISEFIIEQSTMIRETVAGLYFIVLKIAPMHRSNPGFGEFAGPDKGSRQEWLSRTA